MNYIDVIELVYSARHIAKNATLRDNVSEKGSQDFVTAIDLEISEFIKNGIKEIAPNSAFVTEEEQAHSTSNDRFILDPIDGTTNLIHKYNLSSISLAHFKDGQIVFGVVFNPFTDEMWFSVKDNGSYFYSTKFGLSRLKKIGLNNYKENRLSVSANTPDRAILEFGAGSTDKLNSAKTFELAHKIFHECGDLRRMCSTAIAICYIASGKIDGYFERKIKAWDYSAASLILEEAGGKLSEWSGKKLSFNEPSTIIAGNKDVYEYLLNIVKSYC